MGIVFTFEYTTVSTFDPKFTRTAILNTGANEAGARGVKIWSLCKSSEKIRGMLIGLAIEGPETLISTRSDIVDIKLICSIEFELSILEIKIW